MNGIIDTIGIHPQSADGLEVAMLEDDIKGYIPCASDIELTFFLTNGIEFVEICTHSKWCV